MPVYISDSAYSLMEIGNVYVEAIMLLSSSVATTNVVGLRVDRDW